MARLFLGIEIPEDTKARMAEEMKPIQVTSKGWENPHDYHLTLLFIGETESEEMGIIRKRLKDIKFEPFNLTTTSLQFFNRRVMFLGFESSPSLLSLKEKVQTLFPEWAGKETKSFIPHMTVKRWQRYEHAELDARIRSHPLSPFRIPVSHVTLFESKKNEFNEKYHVIDRS